MLGPWLGRALGAQSELTLDKLSDAEREEVFAALAPDEDMRIYGRGIRRRVPPMLGGDRRRRSLHPEGASSSAW